MSVVTNAALAERLKISREAARALAERHRLPRSRANDGKTLLSVDLTEIEHKLLLARSPAAHRVDTFTLKACIDSLQRELAKVEALAAGHRADFERERDRAEQLVTELLKATADTMATKESTARLEGELAVLRSLPWWKRLVG